MKRTIQRYKPDFSVPLAFDADDNPFLVSPDQRNRHQAIIGLTGTGKSRFMEHLIRHDIRRGFGVCVIDPQGRNADSLFNNTLKWLKTEGYEDRGDRPIRIIDITDPDFVTSLNPFPEVAPGEDPYVLIQPLIEVLQRVWKQDFSQFPTIDNLLPAMLVALMERGLTLADLSIIFSPRDDADALREKFIYNIQHPDAREELEALHNTRRQEQFIDRITGPRNRVGRFNRKQRIKQMFSGGGQRLDLARIMDEGEILLVNLGTDYRTVDDDVAKLIGTWLVREFTRQCEQRTNIRRQYYLYVDEAADYLSGDVPKILDACRKQGLSLVMAIQRLKQLYAADDTGNIADAVLSAPNIMAIFGGLTPEEGGRTIAENIFDLSVEVPVEATARAMPNGKKVIVELKSRSTSRSAGRADIEALSRGSSTTNSVLTGQSGGSSTSGAKSNAASQVMLPTNDPFGNPVLTVSDGTAVSQAFADMTGWTEATVSSDTSSLAITTGTTTQQSYAESEGIVQSLIDEYETMYSSVKSHEDKRYAAAKMLQMLPPRHCFISVNRQPAIRLACYNIEAPVVPSKELAAFKRKLYAADPAAVPADRARDAVRDRPAKIREILEPLPARGAPEQPSPRRGPLDVSLGKSIDPTYEKFDISNPDKPDNVTPLFPPKDKDET